MKKILQIITYILINLYNLPNYSVFSMAFLQINLFPGEIMILGFNDIMSSTLLLQTIRIGQICIFLLYDGRYFDVFQEKPKDFWCNFLWM